MPIIVLPHNEREERVLLAFLESLEYEYSEEEDLDIPAPPGAKRQTIKEYNQEIAEAEEEYKRGESFTIEELKRKMRP
jgi:hypothetical protein